MKNLSQTALLVATLMTLGSLSTFAAGLNNSNSIPAPAPVTEPESKDPSQLEGNKEEPIQDAVAPEGGYVCKTKRKYTGNGSTPAEAVLALKQDCHAHRKLFKFTCKFMVFYKCFDSKGNDVTREARASLRKK